MEYMPKFGRVLIRREVKQETKGGIILPDAKRHASNTGIILALGETAGWVEVPNQGFIQTMKVGDQVVFGKHSGAWLDGTYKPDGTNDDGTLFICQDADILAVIKETA
jgi:chaperonin GroES